MRKMENLGTTGNHRAVDDWYNQHNRGSGQLAAETCDGSERVENAQDKAVCDICNRQNDAANALADHGMSK